MSSKFKVLNIALVAVLALGFFAVTSKADVTGNFGIHIIVVPQTTTSEFGLLDIDFQTELNLTYVVSGLSTTFHTHFGIAGVEDVIVTASATLGALDLSSTLVFSRFAAVCLAASGPNCLAIANNTVPLNSNLLFVKKRVTSSISLGGVTFTNLAVFEDVTYPETLAPTAYQTQNFAFGDQLIVSGQTPSGVSLTFQTEFCLQATPNVIKKHAFPYEVNPACATTPKPDILFDRELVRITGVPLAPGVTASGTISCVTITACSLTSAFSFNTPTVPIPFTATFTFTNLTSLTFSGANLVFNAGAGTLTVTLAANGTIAATRLVINATLNPDTNPAQLIIDARITPGVGLTLGIVTFQVTRLGFTMGATAVFAGGPPATFDSIVFFVDVPGGLVSFAASTVFTLNGLEQGEFTISVSF
jgi:hypothetical protein